MMFSIKDYMPRLQQIPRYPGYNAVPVPRLGPGPFNLVTRQNIEAPMANPNVRIGALVHARQGVGPLTGTTACGLGFTTRKTMVGGWTPHWGHRTKANVACMACIARGVSS